jgi:hypothetical protein
MRSLCVLSLPRSLSTIVYHVVRRSIGAAEPSWTTDGEILNGDRLALTAVEGAAAKYVRNGDERFPRMQAFLDDTVQTEGFAYKDVVNPFVACDWLRRHEELAVLKIRRDVAEVAFSMLQKRWLYPAGAAAGEESLIEGLLLASREIERVPGETIEYHDVIRDESVIHRALQRLYTNERVLQVSFIDADFIAQRERVALRRDSEGYRRLAAIVSRCSAKFAFNR